MNKNYKKITHDRESNLFYSLHDSRIKEIKFHNKTLTLKLDRLFEYVDNEEKSHRAEICFEDCDMDLCDVLIFNKTLGKGRFHGKSYDLSEFIDMYGDMEFELITEGYFGYNTTYTGWLWEKGKEPVSCIMYIWNSGNMNYHIFEESSID